jgi:hypothetical protein
LLCHRAESVYDPHVTSAVATSEVSQGTRRLSVTERNWLVSVAIMAGSIAFFALVREVEMRMGRWEGSFRLVRDPDQAAMRYLGIAHFLIAFLYMASSRAFRSAASLARFAALIGVSVLLCFGYAGLSAAAPTLAIVLFIAYFIVHDMRDQFFFSAANGDRPARPSPSWQLDRPILVVLIGTAVVLTASALLGWQGHAIVITHVASWYVFVTVALRKRSLAGTAASGWRDDPRAFQIIHLGGVAILLVLGAVWAYAFRNAPDRRVLSTLLGANSFYYWTIAHVTVSFSTPR